MFLNLFRKKIIHYKGIEDLPLWNWYKINEFDDLSFLLVEKREISIYEENYLRMIFESIYSEFVRTFGINDLLKRSMELRRDIIVLELEKAINNDLSRQTFIDIKYAELKDILMQSESEKKVNIKSLVDKFMGFYVDEKKISVKDYYGYIDLIKKENGR
jgi:hypothetical protein